MCPCLTCYETEPRTAKSEDSTKRDWSLEVIDAVRTPVPITVLWSLIFLVRLNVFLECCFLEEFMCAIMDGWKGDYPVFPCALSACPK